MHVITQIHHESGRLARVRLHQVEAESPGSFDLDEGRDVPVEEVVRLLQAGRYVRVAVGSATSGFSKGGVVSRSWDGVLIVLPLIGMDRTRLDALPMY